MRINFDFDDLEAFLKVAEKGSFSVAADELGLTQPTLTRRIKKLELGLGVQLFERTTRSVKLTMSAKRFRARAQAMLDEARETSLELSDPSARYVAQNTAIITIASVPSALNRLVIPAVQKFKKKRNTSRVRLLDLLANEVVECVAEGTADIGISSLNLSQGETSFDPFFEDRFVAVRRRDLNAEVRLDWNNLLDLPLILPTQGSGNRASIDAAMARWGITLKWSYEVTRTTTGLELVRAGAGVAVLPMSSIPAQCNDLDVYPLSEPVVTRTLGLVQRTRKAGNSQIEALIEEFHRHVTLLDPTADCR